MNPPGNIVRRLASPALLLIFGGFLWAMCRTETAQADFKSYFYAASAYKQGLNPYDLASLSQIAGKPVPFYFVYPPHALFVFRPLTWVSLPTALLIFATIKAASACALALLWKRIFNLGEHMGLFLVFMIFAFNGAMLGDLRVGNISILEQLFIWGGFYCYLKGRVGWCCAAILCAASMKLVPALLLGFLLTTGRRRDWACFAAASALFVGAMALTAALWPELTHGFIQSLKQLEGERGVFNPSTLALLQDAAHWFQLRLGIVIPSFAQLAAYIALGAGALFVSVQAIIRIRTETDQKSNLWRICLVCLFYALIVPRLKNYSYVLLIAPSFFVLMSSRLPNPLILAGAIVMFSTHTNFLVWGRVFEPLFRTQMEYSALVLAWLIWGLCCYSMITRRPALNTSPADHQRGPPVSALHP